MKQWAMVIDVAKCEGCNNCFLACKDEHVGNDWPPYAVSQQLHGERWIMLPKKERGQFPHVDVAYRPTPCMHCDTPACAKAFPEAVSKRKDGIVLIDAKLARGHKEMVAACPYGAIQWNEESQVPQKCTLCAHLLDAGWTQPRCVQACPTGAISVMRVNATELAEKMVAEKLEQLHPECGTAPRVLYANLFRFDSCFVAGTVVKDSGGVEDCVEGALARIYAAGRLLGEMRTDSFGDFKIDRLRRSNRPLSLQIEADGFEERLLMLPTITESLSVGVIALTQIDTTHNVQRERVLSLV